MRTTVRRVACDACGARETMDEDYGLPPGWTAVVLTEYGNHGASEDRTLDICPKHRETLAALTAKAG